LAHALRDLGEYERGIEVLKAAQGDAESAGLTRELAEIFHHRGNIKQLEVDAEGCREANTEALRYAREAGSPELEALALGGLARASVVSRHFKSEQRYALQCIEICRENGLEHIEFTFRHFAALTAFYSADVGTACKEFQACVERGPQVGALRPAIIANLTYAEMLLELGDTGQASQCLDESERLSNIIGEPRYSPCIQALRARIAWSSGNLESASSLVENALLEVSAADERWGKLYLLGALARLTNSPETRLAALEEGAQICSGPCWGIGAVRFLWDAMNASIAAKEWQHANSHAEALERFSRDEPMELFDLLIARTRALANRGLGSETISTGESIEQIRRSIENLGLVDDSAAL
jgi:tetratricopeptide (TPR) repeat protein